MFHRTYIYFTQQTYPYALRLVTSNKTIIKLVTCIVDWLLYCECGFYSSVVDPIHIADVALYAMTRLGIAKPTVDTVIDSENDAKSKSKYHNDRIPINWIETNGFSRFTAHNGCKELSRDALMYVFFVCFFQPPFYINICFVP